MFCGGLGYPGSGGLMRVEEGIQAKPGAQNNACSDGLSRYPVKVIMTPQAIAKMEKESFFITGKSSINFIAKLTNDVQLSLFNLNSESFLTNLWLADAEAYVVPESERTSTLVYYPESGSKLLDYHMTSGKDLVRWFDAHFITIVDGEKKSQAFKKKFIVGFPEMIVLNMDFDDKDGWNLEISQRDIAI